MSISEAFFTICENAEPAKAQFVSLYIDVPFYGGPEEGGWWGSDTDLIAYHRVSTQEEAEQLRDAVLKLAEELNAEARRSFGDQCLREMEWCDARGLDYDYLPEPDGESRYSVVVEEVAGSCVSRGCRHYE